MTATVQSVDVLLSSLVLFFFFLVSHSDERGGVDEFISAGSLVPMHFFLPAFRWFFFLVCLNMVTSVSNGDIDATRQ